MTHRPHMGAVRSVSHARPEASNRPQTAARSRKQQAAAENYTARCGG